MKIVFFGTPEFCLPVIEKIQKTFTKKIGDPAIVGVVTQEPRPTGRKQVLTYSPIDRWAHDHHTPTYYSPQALLGSGIKADIGILAAYGKIINQECLDFFPFGILNIHPSLLPKLRGASPLQTAIAQGENITGASIIKLDDKMDHGPIVAAFTEEVRPDDTPETLGQRIFGKSAQVLVDLIPAYLAGKIKLRQQDNNQATFTKLLNKESGFVPLSDLKLALEGKEAEKLERLFRAMQPWPGIWSLVKDKRLKILKIHLEEGKLIIDEVQLESKNPVPWKQFSSAYQPF